ncbi:MAG: PD-(D/E)XK nuclease-like domain-containing protein [Planctomycetota bacterium]
MTTIATPISDTDNLGLGLNTDLPADQYHALKLASNSLLSKMLQSPAHARYAMSNPSPTTPALKMGSAIHTAVLEPGLYDTAYYQLQHKLDRRTKAGKQQWNDLLLTYGDDYILTAEEGELVAQVRHAVMTHPLAKALLANREHTEASMLWRDEATGVCCRARADAVVEFNGKRFLVDLKTTQDASPRSFERSIFNFGYHRQAAHYLAGAEAVGIPAQGFAIIAVEKTAPYGCAVYMLEQPAVLAGDTQRMRLLERWAECEATGEWPGYPARAHEIGIPAWAERLIENGEL